MVKDCSFAQALHGAMLPLSYQVSFQMTALPTSRCNDNTCGLPSGSSARAHQVVQHFKACCSCPTIAAIQALRLDLLSPLHAEGSSMRDDAAALSSPGSPAISGCHRHDHRPGPGASQHCGQTCRNAMHESAMAGSHCKTLLLHAAWQRLGCRQLLQEVRRWQHVLVMHQARALLQLTAQ